MPTSEIIHIFEKSESKRYLRFNLEIIRSSKPSLRDPETHQLSYHAACIKNDFLKHLQTVLHSRTTTPTPFLNAFLLSSTHMSTHTGTPVRTPASSGNCPPATSSHQGSWEPPAGSEHPSILAQMSGPEKSRDPGGP